MFIKPNTYLLQIARFMGATWVLSAPDGPHVDPMNLAIRDIQGINGIQKQTDTLRCPQLHYAAR